MRAVIIGASAGLGRAIAEYLAASGGHAMFLVASDARDLEALAADLTLRYGCAVHVAACDIATVDPEMLRRNIEAKLDAIDALMVISGRNDPSDYGVMPTTILRSLIEVNFLGPAAIINALIGLLAPGAHLVIAGSVAVMRPRARNGVYGAAKRGLEHYAMALAQAHSDRLGSVCCYRLGYMRTSMTFGQRLMLPVVAPEKAARVIVDGLGRRQGVVHYPRWWLLIGFILNLIPARIYNKLRF